MNKQKRQNKLNGIKNEAVAIERGQFVVNYKPNRPFKIRETEIIIQCKISWLGASSDGNALAIRKTYPQKHYY